VPDFSPVSRDTADAVSEVILVTLVLQKKKNLNKEKFLIIIKFRRLRFVPEPEMALPISPSPKYPFS
jgi:hypothetical protein